MHVGAVILDGYIPIGATGAVLNTTTGTNLDVTGGKIFFPKGIKSVTRNSAGNYTFVLGDANRVLTDNYHSLNSVELTPVCPTATAVYGQLASWNLTAGTPAVGGKYFNSLTVQFVNGSGVATDPPNGGGFLFTFYLNNSAAG